MQFERLLNKKLILLVIGLFIISVLFSFYSARIQIAAIFAPAYNQKISQSYSQPGQIQGAGTRFEIKGSRYLDITLDSTQEIKLKMESVPQMIVMAIKKTSSTAGSKTQLTIKNLVPLTKYYLYTDNYHNLTEFTTDKTGTYVFIQDITHPHLIFIQTRKNTKFIKDNATGGDCVSIGSWNLNTKTCTLSRDVYETIQIDNSNITLDGNGYSVTGENIGAGIYLYQTSGVVVKNLKVQRFVYGILLWLSENNVIENNVVESNLLEGLWLWISDNNTVINNTFDFNQSMGILLSESSINNISNNSASSNYGIYPFRVGIFLADSSNHNTVKNNDIQLNGEAGIIIDYNSSNNLISGNIVSKNNQSPDPVYAGKTGIFLNSARQNKIHSNQILDNDFGLSIVAGNDNVIYNNNFFNNQSQAYVSGGSGNVFNLDLPTGGNYWSNFDAPQEGCDDINGDNICDSPYIFSGNQDNLPWKIKDGWKLGQPPIASDLRQFKSDGQTLIPESATTTENAVVFKASVSSPQNHDIQLQVELRQYNESFTGFDDGGILKSDFVSSGSAAAVSRQSLIDGQYKWRARAVDSQGNKSGWQEFGVSENVDFIIDYVKDINIAVILAEPSDVPHQSNSITAQPCKLIPQKTYPSGHSKEYYEDLARCVADYYLENSYGTVQLNFTIFDNGGQWYRLATSTSNYLGNERELVRDVVSEAGLNSSAHHIIGVIHSGDESYLGNMTWSPQYQPSGYRPFKFIVSEMNFTGSWAHEIGHLIGELIIPTPDNTLLPDLYQMGEIGEWDLMARGSRNEAGRNPSSISSYLKEFLGWLNYKIYPKSAYEEYWVDSINSSRLGDEIFRYNLENTTSVVTQKYYILEARNRNLKIWDSSLPREKALILYYIDKRNQPEYGYNQGGMMYNIFREVTIRGILTPGMSEDYLDLDNFIKFTAQSDELLDNNQYRIRVKISRITSLDLPYINLAGIILTPNDFLRRKIVLTNIAEPVISEYYQIEAEVEDIDISPDLLTENKLTQSYLGEAFQIIKVKITSSKPRIKNESEYIYIAIDKTGRTFKNSENLRNLKRGQLITADIEWGGDPDIGGYVGFYMKNFEIYPAQLSPSPLQPKIPAGSKEAPSIVRGILKQLEGIIFVSWLLLLIITILLRLFLRISLKNRRWLNILIIVSIIGLILSIIWIVLIRSGQQPRDFLSSLFKTTKNSDRESFKSNNVLQVMNEVPLFQRTLPDLDLHLFCDDGRHIGMNYQTGQYENQIPEAIISGDSLGAPEWIFIPSDITGCRYAVSSYDNQKFLEENPSIADQVTDTSDAYEIYARYIDLQTDVYTSQILTNQPINPGQNIYYQTQGTTDISISPIPSSESNISYEGDTSGFFSDKINLKAKLTGGNGQGIPNKSVNFSLLGQSVSAATDSQGLAAAAFIINSIPEESAETHQISISFAGDEQYSASQIQSDFILKSAQWLKQDAISNLEKAKTNDRKIDQKLDSAINLVNKSLDQDLWPDSSRLNYLTKGVCSDLEILQFNPDSVDLEKLFELAPQDLESKANTLFKGKCSKQKLGITAFHNEKTAVSLLLTIQKQFPIIQEIISELTKADGLLAKVSLFDAKNTPVKNPKLQKTVENRIKKAETEIANAEKELTKNRPHKAIARFAKSWLHSQLAIRLANQPPRAAMSDENYTASTFFRLWDAVLSLF